MLRAKLYDLELQKAHESQARERRSQVGTGDRSEKIRTYNFPQGRVTDHRIGLTLYKLEAVLDGALDESAVLEGCTYFGVFFKILLPLTKPAIITVAVLKGVGVYNEYYNANLYLQSNTWRTISTALYSFSGPFKSSYNIICAGVLLTLIPSLIVFLIFQKQVYAGLASGSVKG